MTGWKYRGVTEMAARVGGSKSHASNSILAHELRKELGEFGEDIGNDDLVRLAPVFRKGWLEVGAILLAIRKDRILTAPEFRMLVNDARKMSENEEQAKALVVRRIDSEFQTVIDFERLGFTAKRAPERARRNAVKAFYVHLHDDIYWDPSADLDDRIREGWTTVTRIEYSEKQYVLIRKESLVGIKPIKQGNEDSNTVEAR